MLIAYLIMRTTISAIKADVGGIWGDTRPSDELLNMVRNYASSGSKELLIDSYIGHTCDDRHMVMTHTRGTDNKEIHKLAWDAFKEGTGVPME